MAKRPVFRFETLDVWKRAAAASKRFFKLADHLEQKKHFRDAEQLRSAVLSITNNIAERSGSHSPKEFAQFLNYARRSTFEVANILIIVLEDSVNSEKFAELFIELDIISRQLHSLRKSLN